MGDMILFFLRCRIYSPIHVVTSSLQLVAHYKAGAKAADGVGLNHIVFCGGHYAHN